MPLFGTLLYIVLGFEHIYCRLVKSVYSFGLYYILIEGLVFRVQCTICLLDMY